MAIWCEGARTEPLYLEALRDQPAVKTAAAVDIRIEGQAEGMVPFSLVEKAVHYRRRSRQEKGEIDEFWCVFDVEWPQHHPRLQEAIDLAVANDVKMAISNPCFELWLALHHRRHAGFLTNAEATRLLRDCNPEFRGKSIDGDAYMPLRAQACGNALALDKMHEGNATLFPHNNPSSGMYRLLLSVGADLPIPLEDKTAET